MALIEVAPTDIATVVTVLEMRSKPSLRPLPRSPFRVVSWHRPSVEKYRVLFQRVGARWLWYSRLAMDDIALRAAIDRPETQVHAVIDRAGIEVGLLEFTHPKGDWCALDYFALVPELAGQQHGRWLMNLALAMMWRPGVKMVRVNTCTLDHPSALNFYLAQGFVAISRTVEVFPDPRLIGLLPRDAAPHVPLLAAS